MEFGLVGDTMHAVDERVPVASIRALSRIYLDVLRAKTLERIATIGREERRKAMEEVESIIQGDNVIAQPLWRAVFSATSNRVQGYQMHPTLYHQFQEVWLEG